jgi:phosphoribosylglycinamide formyltransferase 1
VGIAVHQAVLDAQETESGCTVHAVTTEVDAGPILGQATVPVSPDDTPEMLAAKILAEEHILYPKVIAEWIVQEFMSVPEREKADAWG